MLTLSLVHNMSWAQEWWMCVTLSYYNKNFQKQLYDFHCISPLPTDQFVTENDNTPILILEKRKSVIRTTDNPLLIKKKKAQRQTDTLVIDHRDGDVCFLHGTACQK